MWGYNYDGELGNEESGNDEDGNSLFSSTPIKITQQKGNPLQGETIKQVALGDAHTAAIDDSGDL